VPALAVVFLSIVAITGYSGQISLGQAGYAGLGALFFAIFSDSTPELVALLCGCLAAGAVGFLTGYPAIRRRGLFLALTTFAVGAAVSRFVFQQPLFTSGVQVHRPSFLGLSLTGDRAFYVFELFCLAVSLLVIRALREGRLGRALVAMRDSEDGAQATGLDLRVLKVFIFTVSSVLAGVGGALLAQTGHAFDPNAFDPLQGLFWFTTVVVFGADSAAGAVLAAGVVVMVNALTGSDQAYTVVVGALAVLLGRVPGGAVELGRRALAWFTTPTEVLQRFAAATPPPPPPLVVSDAGRARLARARLARARR
jgi:branched-chain amino acid transport system permease protein